MPQIGYRLNPENKIFVADSELAKINKFKTTNGICTVRHYAYRNRPNSFVYITINTKTQGHNSVELESIDEMMQLAQDLKECKSFINKLKKI